MQQHRAAEAQADDSLSAAAAISPSCCQCASATNLGCVEQALHMLYAPSAFGESRGRRSSAAAGSPLPPPPPPLPLRLPDTLVFSADGCAWYRSDSSGLLTRRPHASLHLESVLDALAPGVFDVQQPAVAPGLEHVARALRLVRGGGGGSSGSGDRPLVTPLHPDTSEIQAQFVYSATASVADGESRVVYLTAMQLLRLLTDVNEDWQRPRVHGTLQRFLPPGGWTPPHASQRATRRRCAEQTQHERVFRIAWSPHYTSIESRTNKRPWPLANNGSAPGSDPVLDGNLQPFASPAPEFDVADVLSRLVTFDGPPSCSVLRHVTHPTQRRRFDELARVIVDRLQMAMPQGRRLQYAEMFVKSQPSLVDPRAEHLVLLYVRSLRVTHVDETAPHDAETSANVSTLCVQCGGVVGGGASADFPYPLDPLRPLPDSSACGARADVASRSRRASTMFSFEGAEEAKEEELGDSNAGAVTVRSSNDDAMVPASHEQRLQCPAPSVRRPRTAAPLHLRNHPTSFETTLTPFELAASLDFDLLASLPAETEATGARRDREIVQASLRPRLVADVFAASPNRRQRGVSLVDPVAPPGGADDAGGFAAVPPRSVRTYRDDVLGLYTRDIAASRRKQLQVALRASLPQHSSTSYRKTAPPPSISTCHRFLNPPGSGGTASAPRKRRTQAQTHTPEASVPTLADLLGGDATRPHTSQSARRPATAGGAIPAPPKQRQPNPLSVWRDNFHTLFRRQQQSLARQAQSRPAAPARTAIHPGSASARERSFASTNPSGGRRYPPTPRHFGPLVLASASDPTALSRPRTAQAVLGRYDSEADYYMPPPHPDQYVPNPFISLNDDKEDRDDHDDKPDVGDDGALSEADEEEEWNAPPPHPPPMPVGARPVPGAHAARFPSAPTTRPHPYSVARAPHRRVERVVPVHIAFERLMRDYATRGVDSQVALMERPDSPLGDADVGFLGGGPGAAVSAPAQLDAPPSLSSPRVSITPSSALSCSPRSRAFSGAAESGTPVSSSSTPRAAFFGPGRGPAPSTSPSPPPPSSRPRTYAEVPSSRLGSAPPKPPQPPQSQQPGRGGTKSGANKRSSTGAVAARMSSRASVRASANNVPLLQQQQQQQPPQPVTVVSDSAPCATATPPTVAPSLPTAATLPASTPSPPSSSHVVDLPATASDVIASAVSATATEAAAAAERWPLGSLAVATATDRLDFPAAELKHADDQASSPATADSDADVYSEEEDWVLDE